MSSSIHLRLRRSLIAPLVVTGILVVAAIAFRAPLWAWFTGKPLGGSEGSPVTAQAGPFTIEARLAPDPPRDKDQELVLAIRDAAGKPVDHATVDVAYDMPAMGSMAEMKGGATVKATGDGVYRARFDLPMSASWTLRASVRDPSGSGSQGFQMTVGTAGLTLGAGSGGGGAPSGGAGAFAPLQYPPMALDALRSAMDAYDRARAKLAHDDTKALPVDARTIAEAMRAVHDALPPDRGDAMDRTTAAREASEHLAAAGSVGDARKELAELSAALLPLVGADARLKAGWHVFECPMFEGHPRWMQRSDGADNPYMGMQMPTCGNTSSWQPPDGASSVSGPAAPGEIDHYTCSMHPSVKQAGPGTCPICGMNLVPVTKEQQQEGVVLIDEARRQLIGVRTEPVVEATMRDSFRAVGHVTYDESSLADVNLKVHGWITKLYVSQTGQRVARGQTLFTMYSPELYNAEQDFLLGTKGVGVDPPGGDGGPRQDVFARASRQRLHLLGLADAQIDAIAQQGKPSEELAIPSPANGFVIEKNVVEGASVDAGMKLYRIAALSKVWVEADVYESDLPHVRVGQHARVTLDYLPGRSYDAKVAYIYPYLDPATRTGRVRLELANKELDLKPGMYASVDLSSDLGVRVQVPTAAVVYTGPRRLVFVDLGNGRFRPSEIQVGTESNGMYEVLSGLKAGDSVATSGIFLIAAEARITTAAKYWDSTSEATDTEQPEQPAEVAPVPSPPPRAASPPMPMPSQAPASPKAPSAPPGAPSKPASTDYTCPMHPDVHSPTPGKCPKCGMDLEPRRSTL